MHELQRIAYLEAMGVENYVSTSQLPGAAPTVRLMRVGAPPAANSVQPRGVTNTPQVVDSGKPARPVPIPRIDIDLKPAARVQPAEPVVPPAAIAQGSATVERFSLAVIGAGGFLWVEELEQALLSREQVHLVVAMARALGRAENSPQIIQFDWPMHSNAQLDQGPGAAAASLSGLIKRKMDEGQCERLVLLGEACHRRVEVADLPVEPIAVAVSSAQMLQQPELKRQVWQQLRPFQHS